ncbi:MAG: hypothetical protein KIT61_07415 [Pyrinomonadaceae bacterium]|nr:hypothetical protein [Blastocatellia bacterium]MCW5956397.1 hypothetical protein [Pyrinomonadaceae bacterium]
MRSLVILFVLLGTFTVGTETVSMKPVACQFFTNDNAKKIIGEDVRGVDGDEATPDGGRKWTCTFTAVSSEDGPKVFFMLMRNSSEDAAKRLFEEIRQSNKNHTGFEEWPGVGDEAITHTDGSNFQFLMIRKGLKTIRLKVNPAKGVSMADVKTIASSLASRL